MYSISLVSSVGCGCFAVKDDQLIVAAGNTIRVGDSLLQAHSSSVKDIQFNEYIASADGENIIVWAEECKVLQSKASCIGFGDYVVGVSGDCVEVWHWRSGLEKEVLEIPDQIGVVCNGSRYLTFGEDVWFNGKRAIDDQGLLASRSICCMCYYEDDALAGTDNGEVLVFSHRSLSDLLTKKDDMHVLRAIKLLPCKIIHIQQLDDEILVVGAMGQLRRFDKQFRLVWNRDLNLEVDAVCCMSDGLIFKTRGQLIKVREEGLDVLNQLPEKSLCSFVSKELYCVSVYKPNELQIWSAGIMKAIATRSAISCISGSEEIVALGHKSGGISLVRDGSVFKEFDTSAEICTITNKDGIVVAGDVNGKVITINDGSLTSVKSHTQAVVGVSIDGQSVYSVSADKFICKHNSAGVKRERLLYEDVPLAIQVHQSTIYVSTSNYKIIQLDTDLKVVRTVKIPDMCDNWSQFSFRDDHVLFGTASGDIGSHLLPLDGDPTRFQSVKAHDQLSSVGYSGEGVVSFGRDGELFTWMVDIEALKSFHSTYDWNSCCPELTGDDKLTTLKKRIVSYYCQIDPGTFDRLVEAFYIFQLKEQGDGLDVRISSEELSYDSVPELLRALGCFLSELQCQQILSELQWRKAGGKITLEDFIKLYVNHKPRENIVEKATGALNELMSVMNEEQLNVFLESVGEKFSSDDVKHVTMQLKAKNNSAGALLKASLLKNSGS